MTTVREATLDVMRAYGLTRVFANPGSTEIAFLADLPEDFEFVLGLHEGSVVGMATGYAIATGRPAFVNVHTTAGLGNAVGALATARVNRVPLVVVVGQQDRRHLALEPFLAGRLDGLAGRYPVWFDQPLLAQDVPSSVQRAWHEARQHRGPAVVVVPMDDWTATTEEGLGIAAPAVVVSAGSDVGDAVPQVIAALDRSAAPAVVVGAATDTPAAWTALVRLVERLDVPVWQEAFGSRAGFPQDHPNFAGHLPAGRTRLRQALGPYDLVLVVGTGAFRQYPFEPGPLTPPGVRVVVISDDPEELNHSHADLAVFADPAVLCAAVAEQVAPRARTPGGHPDGHPGGSSGGAVTKGEAVLSMFSAGHDRGASTVTGRPLLPRDVFRALAERLPRDVVLVEETPSSRPDLHRIVPVRQPRGFVSAAMGGLGFGLPAAVGLRMGDPSRPVVAVLGDGSSLYGIQGLWSAARYGCGVLFLVLSNGRYAVMDRLAEKYGGKPPWPAFDDVDIHGLARSFGCPAQRVSTYDELVTALDDVLPTLAGRHEPLLLDIAVDPDPHFEP